MISKQLLESMERTLNVIMPEDREITIQDILILNRMILKLQLEVCKDYREVIESYLGHMFAIAQRIELIDNRIKRIEEKICN